MDLFYVFEILQNSSVAIKGPKLTNTCLLTSRTTRVIIDCTEIRCRRPESLCLNSERFSSYKVYRTLKVLVGISPGGTITFTWGGVLPEKLGGDVRPAPQNPYPIYDLIKKSTPYLLPDFQIKTLFLTSVIISSLVQTSVKLPYT